MKRMYILLLCIVAGSWQLQAQIVNIESQRLQSDTTGWMGSVGGNFSLTKNAEKVFATNITVHAQYKNEKNLYLILSNYGFLKGADQSLINNAFVHLRYNRKLSELLRWEVFTQLQNNKITQIDSRFLAGTGPRFRILNQAKIRLYAATLLMYEYEREKTDPVVTHRDLRNSSYVSFSVNLGQSAELVSTTFYQPRLDKPADYRILNEATLGFTITSKLQVKFQWNYLYDEAPAGEAPNTNYSFTSGLTYNL